MDQSLRLKLHTSRAEDLFSIFRTGFYVNAGLAAIVSFVDVPGWPVATVAVCTAIFVILAADAAMRDLDGLRSEMDDATRNSAYGQSYAKTPYGAFRGLVAALFIAMAVAISIAAF